MVFSGQVISPEKSLFLGVHSPNYKPQRPRAGSPCPRRGSPGSVLSERPLPLPAGSGLPSAWTWEPPICQMGLPYIPRTVGSTLLAWVSRGWVPWRSAMLLGALGRREAQGRAEGTALWGVGAGEQGACLRAWLRARLDSTQLCVPSDVSS